MKFHPHKVHFMIGRGLEDWWWWVCAVWGEEEKVGEYLGVEMQKNHIALKMEVSIKEKPHLLHNFASGIHSRNTTQQ